MAVACYPGSFDPVTVAHVAIVERVLELPGVTSVHLVLSDEPLGKPGASSVGSRVAGARAAVAHLPAAAVTTTAARLLADVAKGYHLLVLGADKWAQIQEERWYGGASDRDAALARLPPVVVVPRPGTPVPEGAVVLGIDPAHGAVSSTAVRAGRAEWRARPRTG